ncbi:Hint domain-containing protein [Roseisalinus antarcticus]|uniref:Bifunctional hemolysin/adenylate cyclase n=1 Tax=Roseisalinus antarcticus TaxID=254357 RepID=A0A1Y5TBB1_9RHOB|nr:Hint domain-containing protein [Roseisalinus antarcticus]SLN60138.1 Bifunctional hemolysin/adenylate cyclase precursor [Roseisalinus antarcticus]
MTDVTLNFEGFARGTVIDDEYADKGVHISSIVDGKVNDSHSPAMVFDSSQPTGGDWDLKTPNLGKVLIVSEDGDSHDPDDEACGGTLRFDFDEPVAMDCITLLDVEEGARVNMYDEDGNLLNSVHVSTLNNGQKVVDLGDTENVARMDVVFSGSGALDNVKYTIPEPADDCTYDGTVEGTDGDDVIDAAYDGDPECDKVDNDDALPAGGDEDLIVAGKGDDTVVAGAADDVVYGGEGNDDLKGGDGNDTIYGDKDLGSSGKVRESFEWDKLPDPSGDGSAIDDGDRITHATQNTGTVNVTFDKVYATHGTDNEFATEEQDVSDIDDGPETITATSGFSSDFSDVKDGRATYDLKFDEEVHNVDFRINDIDGSGTIKVTAFDADGNEVDVDLTKGAGLKAIDSNTVQTAHFGQYAEEDAEEFSVLVQVDGPVSKIVIEHSEGHYNSGVWITDVYFDAVTDVAPVDGMGNDTIDGGDGDDVMYGEGGDDRIIGGKGDDTAYGGDGNDILDDEAGTALDNPGNDEYYGGDGDDKIYTGFEDDTAYGGAGNDIVAGEGGNDEIYGDDGDDTLRGGTGDDEMYGGAGNDRLNGGLDSDSIYGGAGDDEIEGGVGPDYLEGGADQDTFIGGNDGDVVDGGTDGVDNDILDLTDRGPFKVVDETVDADGDSTSGTVLFLDNKGEPDGTSLKFTEIEKILGDRVADNDDPDAVDDTANVAFNGSVTIPVLDNDSDPDGDPLTVIEASSPDGTVEINDGKTITFTPNPGVEGPAEISYTISDGDGGTDSATVTVTVRDGTVEGTAGDDEIDGGYFGDPDGDVVDGNDAILPDDTGNDDLILGFGGDDEIYAGDGNDEARGGDGEDAVYGGDGDDKVFGGDDNDLVHGDAGNDTVDGGLGDDYVRGGTGDDTLQGGAGDDLLDGGDDDDSIVGGEGSDSVLGGEGNDVINAGNHVDPALDTGFPSYLGFPPVAPDADPTNDLDTVDGGAGDDIISTGDDNDSILGGTGNDFIDAGIDDDIVDGGEGDDTIIGGEGEDILTAGDGDDLVYGGLDNDTLDLIDDTGNPALDDPLPDNNTDTIYGGAGNDSLYGRDDDDEIYGGTGDDFLDGGIDEDYLDGGDGDDTIEGGQGNDRIIGGEGNDLAYGGDGDDIMDDEAGTKADNPGDDEYYGGAGNDKIYTGFDDDTLYGGDGDDIAAGEGGNDVIHGDDGDDDLRGGSGTDTLYGGEGDDKLADGFDDDEVYGGDGNDEFVNGQGADMLDGGFGDDVFNGGQTGDQVIGGEDPDDKDMDVLDLTGSDVDYIDYDDAGVGGGAGDAESGRVYFLDGTTMTFEEIERVIPCFTPGTTIATPRGEVLVEDLRVGDRIVTRDNGLQEIRWLGQKVMRGTDLVKNAHLKPVLIKAGSLGGGLPERDMLVSPNHRLLVANDKTQLFFDESEVLASAKHLVGAPGIHQVDVMSTTYIHFMFDQHEVVLSNGAWTESFQPGDWTLKGIDNSQRQEIFTLFPELRDREGLDSYTAARKSLKRHEARLLTE